MKVITPASYQCSNCLDTLMSTVKTDEQGIKYIEYLHEKYYENSAYCEDIGKSFRVNFSDLEVKEFPDA